MTITNHSRQLSATQVPMPQHPDHESALATVTVLHSENQNGDQYENQHESRRVPADHREAGMATAEYAIATLAAVGFAALLVAVLASGEVRGLLMGLIQTALTFG